MTEPAPFTLDRYRLMLQAAAAGGYRCRGFLDGDPRPGDLLLRHDIDLSLAAAIEMAELEADAGVAATYFMMTESVYYNLASRPGRAAIVRIRALGHRIGYHAVYPSTKADASFGFDPVLAWHAPEAHYMAAPVDGWTNAMELRFTGDFSWTYRSDSNMHWRRGDPLDDLRAGRFAWLQLLIHPALWVYEGATMGQTMAACLDADRQAKWDWLPNERVDVG